MSYGLGFLDRHQIARLREIAITLSFDATDLFIAALKQTGKALDSRALAQEFQLDRAGWQQVTEVSRRFLLADPALVADKRRLTQRVREHLKGGKAAARAPVARLAKTFELNIGDPVLMGKYKNSPGRIEDFGETDKGDPTMTVRKKPKKDEGQGAKKDTQIFKVRYDEEQAERDKAEKQAKEFGSDKARKEYLHEHPGVDPKDHSVSDSKPSSGKSKSDGPKAIPKATFRSKTKTAVDRVAARYMRANMHSLIIDQGGVDIGKSVPTSSLPLLFNQPFADAVEASGESETVVAWEHLADRVAAKFQKKKEVPKAKGTGTTTVYEYSDRQIADRHREKARKVEKLRGNLSKLRGQITKDLKSKDEKTRLSALAVGLINDTYERVGNEGSAKDGHFGVTGWQAKHVSFSGGKATITYVGKSGVKQTKTTSDAGLVGGLRDALKGKSGSDSVFDGVDASDVNGYLKPHGVTAKDIRGLHANREVQTRLKAIRAKGGELPSDSKKKKEKLKKEFEQALKEAAAEVGHEAATLRRQYLVPGIEDNFLRDGAVKEKLDKQGKFTRTLKRLLGKAEEAFAIFGWGEHKMKGAAIDPDDILGGGVMGYVWRQGRQWFSMGPRDRAPALLNDKFEGIRLLRHTLHVAGKVFTTPKALKGWTPMARAHEGRDALESPSRWTRVVLDADGYYRIYLRRKNGKWSPDVGGDTLEEVAEEAAYLEQSQAHEANKVWKSEGAFAGNLTLRRRVTGRTVDVALFAGSKKVGVLQALLVQRADARCAKSVAALKEARPETADMQQGVMVTWSELGAEYRGKKVGTAMYQALMAVAFKTLGPFFFMADSCGGSTSKAALRVWAALGRRYPVAGNVVAVLNKPTWDTNLKLAAGLKVFLDDERKTPAGWTRVYWPEEAIRLLKTGRVTEISLDHDLGDDDHGTGYDVVLWIEKAVTKGFSPPAIRVHSANTSARMKMEQGIAQIYKLHARFNKSARRLAARWFVEATKSPVELEDEESERLIRRNPKKKPPRNDLRRNRMEERDPDTEKPGADNDKDLSKNYKRIAGRVAGRWVRHLMARSDGKKPHEKGTVWKADSGVWVAAAPKLSDNGQLVTHTFGKDDNGEAQAIAFSKGEKFEGKDTEKGTKKKKQEGRRKQLREQRKQTRDEIKTTLAGLDLPADVMKALEAKLDGPEMLRAYRDEMKAVRADLEEHGISAELMQNVSKDPFKGLDTSDAEAVAAAVVQAKVRDALLLNPSTVGGKPLSSSPLDSEARAARAEEAMKQFRRVSPEQRKQVAEKTAQQLAAADPESPEASELNAIIDGLHAAFVLNDEPFEVSVSGAERDTSKGGLLREPLSDKLKILLKHMVRKGDAKVLFMEDSSQKYQAKGRAAVRDAMGSLDDEGLATLSEGTPWQALADTLNNSGLELADDVKEYLRSMMRDMAVNSMTTVQGCAAAIVGGKADPSTDPEVYDQTAKMLQDAVAEDVGPAIDEFLADCMAGGEAAAACMVDGSETVQRAQFRATVKAMDEMDPQPDPQDVPVAVARAIANGAPLSLLDDDTLRPEKTPEEEKREFLLHVKDPEERERIEKMTPQEFWAMKNAILDEVEAA